jgi:hypothetical protein
MPIDFFIAPCYQPNAKCKLPGVNCKSTTTNLNFGICDDEPPLANPAYLKMHTPEDWIAEVNNPTSKQFTFKAIDNCVPVYRKNGELESRCDGMFFYDNTLAFIELKDRGSNGWLRKGREQLTITIANFIANHDISQYENIEAFVSNKQRPLAITGNNTEIQMFKDETAVLLDNRGLLLKVERNITI